MPLISVVIPTRHRPKLVLRAIHSVLNQTHREIEIIVVVDGPDEATVDAVQSIEDPRLQLVVNPRSLTAAGARNVGADHAAGDWIAFLDDDDEWSPDKLERQMKLASGATLVTCLSRVVTPLATYVWPRDVYDGSVPLDEYLFDRRSLFLGAGFIQTSSYLLPRRLFNEVRFNVESPHDDWELILRLSKESGIKIATVPDVLVTLYFEEQRASLSNSATWSASLSWIDRIRPIITPRAYSGFCLGVVGSRAAKEGAYAAFPELLQRAFRYGSPSLWHLTLYLAFWLSPQGIRRRLRAVFRGQPA
jgi:glycosyltransferase involved in cell wall biosynthesis